MKTFLLKTTGELKVIQITLFILFLLIGFGSTPAYSQGMGMKKHLPVDSKQTLTDQISEVRSRLFRLESALEKEHRGKSAMTGTMTKKRGMEKMGPLGKVNPNKMGGSPMLKMPNISMRPGEMNPRSKMNDMRKMGMNMMGRMKENSYAFLPSFLPGFPGMSHIYHIGSTGFFLDHSNHISLSKKQKRKLNKIKKQTTLDKSTMDRRIQQLEQELWVLTSSDSPSIKLIEETIKEIEQLRVKMRLTFIKAVGEATKNLSSEQLEVLKGMKHDSI